MASILPRLLQTTRQYASYSSRRASKLWSTGPSKHSNAAASQLQTDVEAQDSRLEVLRTVEMETWSEAMNKTINVPNTYNVTSSHTRAPSALDKVDLKSGDVIHFHTAQPSNSSGSSTPAENSPSTPTGKEF